MVLRLLSFMLPKFERDRRRANPVQEGFTSIFVDVSGGPDPLGPCQHCIKAFYSRYFFLKAKQKASTKMGVIQGGLPPHKGTRPWYRGTHLVGCVVHGILLVHVLFIYVFSSRLECGRRDWQHPGWSRLLPKHGACGTRGPTGI